MINRIKQFLITPFRSDCGINKTLVIVFLLINGIVLLNAILHDPRVGYDVAGHLKYIKVLAKYRLPTPSDTPQFFSPPLSYFLPSLVYTIFNKLLLAAKFAQLLNVLFSLSLTFYLIKICDIIYPQDMAFKTTSLAILGMLTAYYRTFAFVRGEPLVAFFAVFTIYQVFKMMSEKENGSLKSSITLGVSLGLLILSRQWGFFLFPAIGIFVTILTIKQKPKLKFLLKGTILSFIIALIVGGWFYLALKIRYGKTTAFNRQSVPTFSLSNQPSDFYFGLGSEQLFTRPISPSFANQFFPVFYSDIWGDYWGYFVVTGYDWTKGFDWSMSNREHIKSYLGRVNRISLFATAILLAGLIVGTIYLTKAILHSSDNDYNLVAMFSLLQLIIVISFVGYFWFNLSYPRLSKGSTIKATYILHVFPFVAILASEFLQKVKHTSSYCYYGLLVLLVITFLHNMPVMVTRYIFLG